MDTLKPDLFPGRMASLLEGALSFRAREYGGDRDLMPRLAAAQHPEAMIIGCADSRVDPALICGARPGDLFTVRNIANLVPAYEAAASEAGGGRGDGVRAALEFGIEVLGVSHVVVFGHSRCAGVQAMIDAAGGGASALEFLGPWLSIAAEVPTRMRAETAAEDRPGTGMAARPLCAAHVERRSIQHSVDNLHTYPWVRDRVAAGTLGVHGWWFDLDSGRLWATSPETGAFLPVEAGG